MLKALKLLLAASDVDVPGKSYGYVGYVNHLKMHRYIYEYISMCITTMATHFSSPTRLYIYIFHKMLFNEGETVIFTWN